MPVDQSQPEPAFAVSKTSPKKPATIESMPAHCVVDDTAFPCNTKSATTDAGMVKAIPAPEKTGVVRFIACVASRFTTNASTMFMPKPSKNNCEYELVPISIAPPGSAVVDSVMTNGSNPVTCSSTTPGHRHTK